MVTVNIFDKKQNLFLTYEHIHKITYCDMIEEHVLTEKNMLTHNFQLGFDLHFFF